MIMRSTMIIHDEAVKKVLMESGWWEERNVDITEYTEAYKKNEYDNGRFCVSGRTCSVRYDKKTY